VAPNIFPVYYVSKCQQTIAVYTMQAVKIVLPVYFLAKFDTSEICKRKVAVNKPVSRPAVTLYLHLLVY